MTKAARRLEEMLAARGFLLVGGFDPKPDDHVPVPNTGSPPVQVLVIGSTAPQIWPVFSHSPEFVDGQPDPLDRYTKRVLTQVAEAFGVDHAFPFEGPPYHPFQRWAQRCGGFSPSPVGVLAHRTYGPWMGLRAAFFSTGQISLISDETAEGPCPACMEKPCIEACPAAALTARDGYDVPRCMAYLHENRESSCFSGCAARRACPYGPEHAHSVDAGRFHMNSFLTF
ncbi:hypothetical protein [Roseibium sp. RKSG952]|uniref:hypothetical protein n=1 Tax=Roseibium sp. RKSG952 TaxID=2529384 RepID=UPI0012BBFBDE|nr:hypothetical protein [Roseibium sp. RKSG952]MTH97843.1 hypothetical protein [Roseibium sp. RKSG952]